MIFPDNKILWKKKILRYMFSSFVIVLLLFEFVSYPAATQTPTIRTGQSRTQLADGSWLILGGQDNSGLSGEARIHDAANRSDVILKDHLHFPRAWHSATILPDGSVFIYGGIGSDGLPCASIELFHPQSLSFEEVSSARLTPRAYHTASLLTEGRVIIAGGMSNNKEILNTAEMWDPQTKTARSVPGNLAFARMKHKAMLLPDGRVFFQNGKGTNERRIDRNEIYDPSNESFDFYDELTNDQYLTNSTLLAFSIPTNEANEFPTSGRIVLRLSEPVLHETVNGETILLKGPQGMLSIKIVSAEGGRLVFITPDEELLPATSYALILHGLMNRNHTSELSTIINFSTSSSDVPSPEYDDDEVWSPQNDPSNRWKTGRSESRWSSLPPLHAPTGVTALSGQTLKLNGNPLKNVTIRIGNAITQTNNAGQFLLTSIGSGWSEMIIDGHTAGNQNKEFGTFEVRVKIVADQTNVLPYTIWMPRLDTEHEITIPSPTTSEVIITTPRIPGLEVHIPAGTYIKDNEGNTVTKIGITPIPLDRTPFPIPDIPIYFTIQPGAAYLYGSDGARIHYPNLNNYIPSTRVGLYHYDPEEKGWYIYGEGDVEENGQHVVPEPGVAVYEFTGASMFYPHWTPPAECPTGTCDGDPVDCYTGLFVESKLDLSLPDVLPIVFERTYRSRDANSRAFGIGTSHQYQMFLYSTSDLVLPDGTRIHYTDVTPPDGDPVYENTNSPTIFYKSRLYWKWSPSRWELVLKNGTVYVFGEIVRALEAIRDRYGNQVTITRTGGQNGNISQITSSNGKWISFTYDSNQPLNRIIKATDNLGRTVNYTYDTTGRLWRVTDPMGGVTEYTYDTQHRIVTVKNPRGYLHVTNEYDANGRVFRQTQADSTTFQFIYTLDGNGKVIQTDVTNPRGYVRRRTFNSDGYVLTDTKALGMSVQQTSTYELQTGTNLVLSMTDQLLRKTSYSHDAMGNVTGITHLDGTPQAVTTSFGYESAFNKMNSVTDSLNHTTSITYDVAGNPTTITDPLNNQASLTYNSSGQPLTLTDPMNNVTAFSYTLGSLTGVTFPLNRTLSQFVDIAGRPTQISNPSGQSAFNEYDSLNRVIRSFDSQLGVTAYAYDSNSNLLSVTDPRNKTNSYTYDALDRIASRTDPLLHSDSYLYDNNGNLQRITDRKNQITNYTYDPLDRLTQIQFHDGSTISYTYDLGNRITQLVDSISGTIIFGYNGLNRLTSQTSPQGVVSYTYDNANRRSTMTVAGQTLINYAYDNANRLTQITQGAATVVMAYDAAGRRTSVTLPNNIKMEYTYNSGSDLTEITYKQGLNVLGNLIYEYDQAAILTKVGGTFARTNLPPALASATYNDANQQITFGTQSLTYDNNGNLVNDGINGYTWNVRNQLTNINGPGLTASFQYDSLGRRISKTINGSTTSFLYDGLNSIQELASGTPTANLLTGGVDEYFNRTDAVGSRSFLTDGLRSTIALADSNATIQTEYKYEPFGSLTTSGASSSNSYSFTGRETDGTGLFYYRARYYHPRLQRFVSEDPLGFGSGDTNLYAYVFNSPTNFIDPLGLIRSSDEDVNVVLNYMQAQGILGDPKVAENEYKAAQYLLSGDLYDPNGVTMQDVIDALTLGNGPDVILRAIGGEGSDTCGHYDNKNKTIWIDPNVIKMAADAIRSGAKDPLSKPQFAAIISILHEIAHYLDWLNSKGEHTGTEVGKKFEELMYPKRDCSCH